MNTQDYYRNVCFTINNYVEDDLRKLKDIETLPYFKYIVYQTEKGESGTVHLQGYVEFNKSIRFNKLKKLMPRAHLEKRYGTRLQAIDYCKKLDTRIEGPSREYSIDDIKVQEEDKQLKLKNQLINIRDQLIKDTSTIYRLYFEEHPSECVQHEDAINQLNEYINKL